MSTTPGQPSHAMSLAAIDVAHRFGSTDALRDITVHVTAGRSVALVGESGSGKTTLLRCFNRMAEPWRGRVEVDGADVRTVSAVDLRRRIGYVPQQGGLLPHWRVLRNVAFVPTLRGMPEPAAAAERALDLAGLAPARFRDRFPHELSGGERQRVALARALAARPGAILLDEPFGALDAITRADLQASFEALRREIVFTSLLVTHDIAEAARLADELVVMRAGRVEQAGSIEELLRSPASAYVRDLLDRALSGTARLKERA